MLFDDIFEVVRLESDSKMSKQVLQRVLGLACLTMNVAHYHRERLCIEEALPLIRQFSDEAVAAVSEKGLGAVHCDCILGLEQGVLDGFEGGVEIREHSWRQSLGVAAKFLGKVLRKAVEPSESAVNLAKENRTFSVARVPFLHALDGFAQLREESEAETDPIERYSEAGKASMETGRSTREELISAKWSADDR